jgi:hypothetical protein
MIAIGETRPKPRRLEMVGDQKSRSPTVKALNTQLLSSNWLELEIISDLVKLSQLKIVIGDNTVVIGDNTAICRYRHISGINPKSISNSNPRAASACECWIFQVGDRKSELQPISNRRPVRPRALCCASRARKQGCGLNGRLTGRMFHGPIVSRTEGRP